jgi:large subunit ribosomal protein L11
MPEIVEVLITGGKATPGPPVGPSLAPLGVNIREVVERINEETKGFEDMQVPVKIVVDEDKNVSIEVGIPPTSALIKQELGIQKVSEETDVSLDKIIEIARMKKERMLSYSLKNAVKEVLGTCVSMSVLVGGKSPKEVQEEIDEGKHDEYFV